MNETKERALRSIYECVAIAVRNGLTEQAQEMASHAALIERQNWEAPQQP